MDQYELRYLPLFYEDLSETVYYIRHKLKNHDAADHLIDDVESAIIRRLENPESFEQYHSSKERKYPYDCLSHATGKLRFHARYAGKFQVRTFYCGWLFKHSL